MKTLSLLMLFILTSCFPSFNKTSLNFDDGAISVKPILEDEEAVNFQVLKDKLLVPHCLSCHKNIGSEEKLLGWVKPGNYEESKLYQVIKDGSMPKRAAPLDSKYLDLVIGYIESVKKPETPEVVPEVNAFESIRQKILIPHCISCHATMTNEGSLAPFIIAGKPLESEFYMQIADGRMPMGAEALSSEEVALVKEYIESLP